MFSPRMQIIVNAPIRQFAPETPLTEEFVSDQTFPYPGTRNASYDVLIRCD
jgi:hypothetical protein